MNTENNKIISEFMGLELEETPSGKFVYARNEFNNANKENDCQTNFYEENELCFHSDWNWLIEVVEKIENLNVQKLSFNFNIQKDRVSLCYAHISEPKKQIEMYFEWVQKTKIENLNKIVVEFIKWYNEQKK